MDRRSFIRATAGAAVGAALSWNLNLSAVENKPNIIIIMADDMGYGDLSCYGSESINTPNLDGLASRGVKFNSFFSSASICSPSRSGLLTGRYPARTGVTDVYFPSQGLATPLIHGAMGIGEGMNVNEVISAQLLRDAGYSTCCIGKWHLGDKKEYRANHRGFDHYMGVQYSNDMLPLPLYRNDKIIRKSPVDQDHLTRWYTLEALEWLKRNNGSPFFLYFAHTFPHQPLHASPEFRGKSNGGLYGDCVEEIDWSVGKILEALDEHGIADNTFVFFTSDNGPWFQGSPGENRGRKGEIFDGGMNVPGIARWPGVIPAGLETDEIAMNIDLFSTILDIAGVPEPSDRIIDGQNIMPVMKDGAKSPHDALYFYRLDELVAVRTPRWKYHRQHAKWSANYNTVLHGPSLFDMKYDYNESYNVIDKYPEVAKELDNMMREWEKNLVHDVDGWENS